MERLGVKDIWAKANDTQHGRIAERVGAHHVIYPKEQMGKRVAHLVTGKMIDSIEFDDGFAIAKADELQWLETPDEKILSLYKAFLSPPCSRWW